MRQLCFALCFGLLALGYAQVSVGVDLPAGSVITVSQDKVTFDLSDAYPPPSFPAYYGLPDPIKIEFFSNINGNWSLKASFADGLISEGGPAIPLSQLEYRLNGGEWRSMGQSISLLNRVQATASYEQVLLELRLKLVGNERPGRYRGVLDLTLTGL